MQLGLIGLGRMGGNMRDRIRAAGHEVVGLDPVPSEHTAIVGSIADRAVVRSAIADGRIQAIVHAGALHKPHIERHSPADFVAVNVAG